MIWWQLLAELLRSKNPEDLQEANRLIKNMVKEVRGSLDVIKMLIWYLKMNEELLFKRNMKFNLFCFYYIETLNAVKELHEKN